jgi:hypothetical protein
MAAAGHAAKGRSSTAVAANAMTRELRAAVTAKFMTLQQNSAVGMVRWYAALTKPAATANVMTRQRRNAVAILFGEVNMYAALVKPVVKANAVLRARPAVILV